MPVPLGAGPSVYPKDGGARVVSLSILQGSVRSSRRPLPGPSGFARGAQGGQLVDPKGGAWRSTMPALCEARVTSTPYIEATHVEA
jgi:hypothetical protein